MCSQDSPSILSCKQLYRTSCKLVSSTVDNNLELWQVTSMAKAIYSYVVELQITSESELPEEMITRYVSRALRGFAKHDPECLFEHGNKPIVTLLNHTLRPSEVSDMLKFLIVSAKIRGK